MRTGAETLALLGTPRVFLILRALAEGTNDRMNLRRAADFPSQSTLRSYLSRLEAAGIMDKWQLDTFPGAIEYSLTEAGRQLLPIAEGLERWLQDAPGEPLELGSNPARAAIKGLVSGWTTAALSCLAEGPCTLTELDKRVAGVSYPTLERCLEAMRVVELVDAGERKRNGTPFKITEWARRGVSPLALAARWEYTHRRDGPVPIRQDDVGDAITLAGPLCELPEDTGGVCRLAVKPHTEEEPERALGELKLRGGRIDFGTADAETKPDVWASGTVGAWFETVIDGSLARLRTRGDHKLAKFVFAEVNRSLFRAAAA